MSEPILAYFYGVYPGQRNGHFTYAVGSREFTWTAPASKCSPWGHPASGSPIGSTTALTATWGPNHENDIQPEGEARFARKDGWTLIALWDRSADKRGGCCALFALQVEATDAEAVQLAKHLFPSVFARIEAHVGRPLTWQSACCPACRRPFKETP